MICPLTIKSDKKWVAAHYPIFLQSCESGKKSRKAEVAAALEMPTDLKRRNPETKMNDRVTIVALLP